jgi:hypothetical protein
MAAATPPTATLQRLGQIKGTGDDRALFLKLGIAEVIGAMETNCVFKGKLKERNIKGGKSAAFPIAGKMSARYHTPGEPILGQGNEPSDLNEVIINLDGLLIADTVVYELDELMSYWPVRQEYTKQLGLALAYEWDRRAARVIYGAAKSATEPLALSKNQPRTGAGLTLSAGYAAATAQAKGDELVSKIFDARVALEKKDVPINGMYGVFSPEEYFYISQSSRAINADFNGGGGGNGTIAEGRTMSVAGIPLYMSNHVTQAAYTNVTGDKNTAYQQDLSKCVGMIFSRECAGVLTLKQPSLQMTSGDFNIEYQGTLLLARMSIGMGTLRQEAAVVIEKP